jgi:hypothetical protein
VRANTLAQTHALPLDASFLGVLEQSGGLGDGGS